VRNFRHHYFIPSELTHQSNYADFDAAYRYRYRYPYFAHRRRRVGFPSGEQGIEIGPGGSIAVRMTIKNYELRIMNEKSSENP